MSRVSWSTSLTNSAPASEDSNHGGFQHSLWFQVFDFRFQQVCVVRQPTVSAGLVSGLVTFAAQHGIEPSALLRQAGIEPSLLEDLDNRAPLTAYIAAMRTAKALTGNNALALHCAAAVGMREISIVGLIMEAAATIGEAYIQMRRFGRLAMEIDVPMGGPRFELVSQDDKFFLVDRLRMPEDFPELTEAAFTWLICGPRRYMDRSPVVSAHISYAAPAHSREYERIFQCPVTFSAPWNALEMHPQALSWQVAQNPTYVFGLLTERAESLLADIETAGPTAAHLRSVLLTVLHHGGVRVDDLALQMGISRQTLFRRLRREGTTYEEVLDQLRRRLALDYLRGGKASVSETAYLVGFSDASTFSRAFKRWTGQTPRAFRRSVALQRFGSA